MTKIKSKPSVFDMLFIVNWQFATAENTSFNGHYVNMQYIYLITLNVMFICLLNIFSLFSFDLQFHKDLANICKLTFAGDELDCSFVYCILAFAQNDSPCSLG